MPRSQAEQANVPPSGQASVMSHVAGTIRREQLHDRERIEAVTLSLVRPFSISLASSSSGIRASVRESAAS